MHTEHEAPEIQEENTMPGEKVEEFMNFPVQDTFNKDDMSVVQNDEMEDE